MCGSKKGKQISIARFAGRFRMGSYVFACWLFRLYSWITILVFSLFPCLHSAEPTTSSHLHDPFSHLIPCVQPFGNFFGTSLSRLMCSNDEASHSSPWQARPSDSTAARARRNMAKSHRKMMKHVGFTKRLQGWFQRSFCSLVPLEAKPPGVQVFRCKPFKFGVVKISLRFMGFMSAMLTK